MASKVRDAEGSAAPTTAPHAIEEEGGDAPSKRVARVRLVVGKSGTAHGMRFTADHPQMVADGELIEAFLQDGNFSVEMVPVTGGNPARQR